MGKGYNNYMCKKPFHPGSKANIKRAWMAEQKTDNEKRKQEDLKVQYEKEQDLYNNRALISSESKDKLELNFMYEAPPGAKRERQKEDDEPEYKFEWQRKYNAPREDYAKGNEDIKDQPFGIPVRNVRCIKCHKWGHINTDKECPLYHQASSSSMPTTSMDPLELMRQMKEDGYGLKENVLGHQLNPGAANQQFIPSDESDPEMDFLKSLSTSEKKKLLRKLKKLSKKQEKSSHCKKKKSKKSKKSKVKDSSSSESEEEKKVKKKKKSKRSSSSESESSDESEKRNQKHLNSKMLSTKEENKTSKKTKEVVNSRDSESHHKKTSEYHPHEKSKKEIKNSKLKKYPEEEETSNHRTNNSEGYTILQKSKQSEAKLMKGESMGKTRTESKSTHSTSSPDRELHKMEVEDVKPNKKTSRESSVEVENLKKKSKSDASDTGDSCGEDKRESNCHHPDGFSHLCPQGLVKANYLQTEEVYKGKIHDRFRHFNRDKRSPSVKQKYHK